MIADETYISRRFLELQDLFKNAKGWASKDDKLAANLAALLNVLIVGVIEDCIEYLIATRVKKTHDSEVEHYIVQTIHKRFRNPDHEAISGMLKEFSETYKRNFKEKIPGNSKEATSLKSLIDNKNSLTHKGTSNLSLTIKDVENYFNDVIRIVEALEQVLS